MEMEVCIDDVEGLGTFVEIEKMGEDPEAAEKELFKTAGQLGLNDFTVKSYLCLLEEKTNAET